ncbi:LysE family translocator [Propionivibrio sp.]|uniref:LysE family translocator n=1 Tax=Propionivibrio sp. TaxID=2212460 RepID=UPI0039E61FB7
MSAEFLLTSLVVVLIPGTGVLFTVSAGLFLGRRASLYAALGCTLGILPHLLASVLGLAALLHVSAIAFHLFKLAGAAYMLYLAWTTWRERGGLSLDRPEDAGSAGRIVWRAVLMNVLNPKLTIFFLAYLPQFIPAGTASPLPQMLALSAVFMAMTLVVFIFYGLLAHAAQRAVLGSPRVQDWMRRGFAAVFAGLGINLALADR